MEQPVELLAALVAFLGNPLDFSMISLLVS